MAKATVRNNPVVNLELSSEEAFWLKSLTQNFIGPTDPLPNGFLHFEAENDQSRRIRRAIFEALPPFDTIT